MAIRKNTVAASDTATASPMTTARTNEGRRAASSAEGASIGSAMAATVAAIRTISPVPTRSSRSNPRHLVALVLALAVLAACGGDGDDVGDQRADQARQAAVDAGLDDDVADFLALAARGATSEHQVTYPGPSTGTQLVVANRPPDRRVDLVADGEVREIRLVLDGEAFTCVRDPSTSEFEPCERVDAIVEPPGAFDPDAIASLVESLRQRIDDFAFEIETRPIAGVEAICLVTRILAGRERPELGDGATLCVSPEGVLLFVDQAGEQLEASDYATAVAEGTFERPDGVDGDR